MTYLFERWDHFSTPSQKKCMNRVDGVEACTSSCLWTGQLWRNSGTTNFSCSQGTTKLSEQHFVRVLSFLVIEKGLERQIMVSFKLKLKSNPTNFLRSAVKGAVFGFRMHRWSNKKKWKINKIIQSSNIEHSQHFSPFLHITDKFLVYSYLIICIIGFSWVSKENEKFFGHYELPPTWTPKNVYPLL